jgi:deazaflavin-dependent oxidoreductase (nitroreductase family)
VDTDVERALATDTLVDITTTGRRTCQPRRKEIWFHAQDGRLFITGTPGRRDWYANLAADPAFTLHFKQSLQRDVPARATPITDPAARREIFGRMRELEPRMHRMVLDEWVEGAPLVEVELLEPI